MTKRYYIKYNKFGGADITFVDKTTSSIVKPSLDNIAVNKNELIKIWNKIIESGKENCLNLPYYCKKELNEIFTKIKFFNIPLFNEKSQFLIPVTDGQQKYDLNNFIFNKIGSEDMKGISYLPMFSFKKINSFPAHEIKDVSLQEILNLQKHQMFETIRENTRNPDNNNEAKELHNTMFLYGVPSREVIEFLKYLEKARELIDGKEYIMEYKPNDDSELKKIKLIIKSPKGMTSVMESKNKDDPFYMTWSENTLAMFSFKQNISESEVPEYNINKFEYLALIQWILFENESPYYEEIQYKDEGELNDRAKYNDMFELAIKQSKKRILQVKNLMYFDGELINKIKQIRMNKMTLNLKAKKMQIIFSHEYILSRQLGIGSFVPFKYSKKEDFEKGIEKNILDREKDILEAIQKPEDKKELRDRLNSSNYIKQFDDGKCNNGSLCCESKLFSFICDKNPGKFPTQLIKGETCYWMCDLKEFKKDPPKDKTLINYSFAGEKFKDIRKLMCQEIRVDADEDNLLCVGHFALPCPGCQINYFNYLLNKRDIWDRSDECGEEIDERKKIEREIIDYVE